MKSITNKEKKEWSRAKVLKTSKYRFDSYGISISDPEIYLHMKRMFLHTDEYEMIKFNLVKESEIKKVLNKMKINYSKPNERLVLDMKTFNER